MAAATPAAPPPVPVVSAVFGRSVRRAPLWVTRVGPRDATRRVLVVGAIHGTEPAGRPVARALLRARPPAGTALWLVGTGNPDGERAGTRHNARGVDLNRNWPDAWRWTGPNWSTYASGARPLSEPEPRALRALILRVRPTAAVWYHQHMRLVYRQGGARPELLRRYGRLSGLPVRQSPRFSGTAIRWENDVVRGGTAFVVELPAGRLSAAGVRRNARAALSLLRP